MSSTTLVFQTVRTSIIGVVALGALLFVPAWTLDYWQGWAYIAVFTACTTAIGVYLALKDPALLERRKKVGPGAEQSTAQRIIMSLAIATSLGMMVVSALDHRFRWAPVPAVVSVVANAAVAVGLLLDLWVLRENTYGGSSIEVIEGQQVISTGPYALVRHPMYTGALLAILATPLALGSWWGLLLVLVTTPVLVWRILDEEQVLRRELAGYAEYTQRVRYRLVPGVW